MTRSIFNCSSTASQQIRHQKTEASKIFVWIYHLWLSSAMFPVKPTKLISQYLPTAVFLQKQMSLAKLLYVKRLNQWDDMFCILYLLATTSKELLPCYLLLFVEAGSLELSVGRYQLHLIRTFVLNTSNCSVPNTSLNSLRALTFFLFLFRLLCWFF